MRPVNVIVVDDSAFMRKSLETMIEGDPRLHVIATARNGQEAVDLVKKHRPDVVTMDIEMPIMDGLTALSIIMKECPTPVMMVSSLTSEGADATLDALERGAVDFIPKQLSFVSLDILKIKEILREKLLTIAAARRPAFRRSLQSSPAALSPSLARTSAPAVAGASGQAQPLTKLASRMHRVNYSAVVLGISTGGPQALMRIIPKLPQQLPVGIAVVQHMPPRFTASLADRLNSQSEIAVKEAEDGELFRAGTVYIAPGGMQMNFRSGGGGTYIKIVEGPPELLFKPCVDFMVNSAVEQFRSPLLGVIMTGMGKDGLEGMRHLRSKGGNVMAQSEDSCVVYGMPRATIEAGMADYVFDIDDIPTAISRLCMHD